MATITLRGSGRSVEDDLPMLCMKCGSPAAHRRRKTFRRARPGLLKVFVSPILAWYFGNRKTCHVPLCENHKNHFSWRTAVLVVQGVAFILWVTAFGVVSAS